MLFSVCKKQPKLLSAEPCISFWTWIQGWLSSYSSERWHLGFYQGDTWKPASHNSKWIEQWCQLQTDHSTRPPVHKPPSPRLDLFFGSVNHLTVVVLVKKMSKLEPELIGKKDSPGVSTSHGTAWVTFHTLQAWSLRRQRGNHHGGFSADSKSTGKRGLTAGLLEAWMKQENRHFGVSPGWV